MELASIDSVSRVLAQALSASSDTAGDFNQGLAIAAAGITIVFSALLLISLFIASLPRILRVVNHIWPEVQDGHHEAGHPESQVADDTDVLAAIGFVLHTEFQRQLSAESLAAESSTAGKN
jgi:Na+-transporting methylmalonyl-CoA/oxaloacetate decarboxylase gamma subunit